jgi:hypothetical protein
MAKKAVIHVSPANSSSHHSLLSEIQNAGFDPEILRNTLWLINAHDDLISFPRICSNIINIVEAANANWGETQLLSRWK